MDEYFTPSPDALAEANRLLDEELAKRREAREARARHIEQGSAVRAHCRDGNEGSGHRTDPFGSIPAEAAGMWTLLPLATEPRLNVRERLGPVVNKEEKAPIFKRLGPKEGASEPEPMDTSPTTDNPVQPLNPGRFQNHENLKVIPLETPKPRQTFEEVKEIARKNRKKNKKQRAKARKAAEKERVKTITNTFNHLPLPQKPDPITKPAIIRVEAGYSIASKDRKTLEEGPGASIPLMPPPVDWDDDDEEWRALDALNLDDSGNDVGDFQINPATGKRQFPKRYKPKGVLSVEIPPLPDSTKDSPMLTRAVDWMFYAKKSQLQFYIVSDQWLLLERSLKVRDMFRPNLINKMPEDTISEVLPLGRSVHLQGTDTSRYHPFYDTKPSPTNLHIRDFIREVDRTRILCVNTEGKKQFLSDGRTPRVNVAVGNIKGTVLYFNDYHLVPEAIRAMFDDPKYTKVGSGLAAEMAEFDRLRVRLRNWVEVGSMRLALYPPAWEMFQRKLLNLPPKDVLKEFKIGHGIEYMVRDLVEAGYYPQEYKRTEYAWWEWDKPCYEFKKVGKPHREMLPHFLENVRTPFAEMILIVDLFAKLRGYKVDTEPFYPILYEALDLCRLRSSEVLQANLDEDWSVFNWTARVTTGDRSDHQALPSQCMELYNFLCSRADFVEPLLKEDLKKTAELVYKRFSEPGGVELPSHEHILRLPLRTLLAERCPVCGRMRTEDHHCETMDLVCLYPHDGATFDPHTTLCCPNLHHYCRTCQLVGHQEDVHNKPLLLKTARELRQRYFQFASQGLFTSIPFLVNHRQGRRLISAPHWKASYDGNRYNASVVTRYQLGVIRHIPLCQLGEEHRLRDEKLHRESDQRLLEAVHANVMNVDLNFKPVKRSYKAEIVAETRQKAVQERKDKDALAKAAKAQRREKEKEKLQSETAQRRKAARELQQNDNRRILLEPTKSEPPARHRLFRRD
jgi:hypothetical protein